MSTQGVSLWIQGVREVNWVMRELYQRFRELQGGPHEGFREPFKGLKKLLVGPREQC